MVSAGETVALQCKATGSPPPRITWLKGNRPLSLTERHHFTPGNQLLVVQNVVAEDAGRYTCEMSNALGTERAHSQLSVVPGPGCRRDGSTAGVFTVAVVCSVVLTSLAWVCIIYQTRKKREEYSVTSTGQTRGARDVREGGQPVRRLLGRFQDGQDPRTWGMCSHSGCWPCVTLQGLNSKGASPRHQCVTTSAFLCEFRGSRAQAWLPRGGVLLQ